MPARRPGAGTTHPSTAGTILAADRGESLFARSVNRDDLVEAAYLEDLPNRIRERAEQEFGIPLPQRLCDEQDDSQARTADIGETLQVHDDSAVVGADRSFQCFLEITCVHAVDASLRLGNQGPVVPFGLNVHLPRVLVGVVGRAHELRG